MVVKIDKMDTAARNKRLYNTLKDMGLFVAVQGDPDNPADIDSLVVSTAMPKVSLYSLEAAKECLEKSAPPVFMGSE